MLNKQPHRTKQALVYQALRSSIMRCELHPGHRLIIDDISRQLGVSHIPVREALQQLQSEGLVVNVPHSGATVAPISQDDLTEVFTLMEGLEFVAMRIVAERMTPEILDHLTGLVEEMDAAVASSEGERWATINTKFHRAIADATGMPLLEEMTDRTLDHWDRVRRYFNILFQRIDRAQEQHHRILEALAGRDIDALQRLATIHNRDALAAYLTPAGAAVHD